MGLGSIVPNPDDLKRTMGVMPPLTQGMGQPPGPEPTGGMPSLGTLPPLQEMPSPSMGGLRPIVTSPRQQQEQQLQQKMSEYQAGPKGFWQHLGRVVGSIPAFQETHPGAGTPQGAQQMRQQQLAGLQAQDLAEQNAETNRIRGSALAEQEQARAVQLTPTEFTPEEAAAAGHPEWAGIPFTPASKAALLKQGSINDTRETIATQKPSAEAHDAFNEWLKNPSQYEAFEKAMTAAKAKPEGPAKNAGFMSTYAAIRGLQLAYSHNPALLPVLSPILTHLFTSQGIQLPANAQQVLASTPLDQPLSPTTGEPIGTGMPGAPTGATRSQAQVAARVLSEVPTIRQEVSQAADNLGPVKGRTMVRYLLGMAGSTGDPQTDRQLSKVRSDLTFMASGSAKFHINSVRQAELYEKLLDAGKSPAEAIQGTLDSMEDWATKAQAQERGFGEQGGKQGVGGNAPKVGDKKNGFTFDGTGWMK